MITMLAIVAIVQSLVLLFAAWVIWQQANRLKEPRRHRRRVSQTRQRPLPGPEDHFVAEVRRILDQ